MSPTELGASHAKTHAHAPEGRFVNGFLLFGSPETGGLAAKGFRPRFVPSTCLSTVPDDPRVSCGWLVTREDRSASSGPKASTTIRLS